MIGILISNALADHVAREKLKESEESSMEVETKRKEIDETRSELARKRVAIEVTSQKMEDGETITESRIRVLNESIAKLIEENDNLKDLSEILKKRIADLSVKNESINHLIGNMRAQEVELCENLMQKIAKLSEENEELKTQIANMQVEKEEEKTELSHRVKIELSDYVQNWVFGLDTDKAADEIIIEFLEKHIAILREYGE